MCKNRVGIDQPNQQPIECPVGYTFNEDTCQCVQTSNITQCQAPKFLWDDNAGQCICPKLMCNQSGQSGYVWDSDKCACVNSNTNTDNTNTGTGTTNQNQPSEFPWPWVVLSGLIFVGGIITIAAIKANDSSDYGNSDSSGFKKLEEPNIIKKIRDVAKQCSIASKKHPLKYAN